MDEGSLYCEHCGEDIHIVPDFEPELERNLEQSITRIQEDLQEQEPKERESSEGKKEAGGQKASSHEKPVKKKRQLLTACLILGGLLAMTAAGGAGWMYTYYSEEYQSQRAVQYVAAGKYDKAISCYNRAIELDQDNIEFVFSLAEVYFLKNNKVEYEYLLRDIIRNENASSEQLDRAYGKLIAIYRDRGDYQTINDLLLACDNEALVSMYQNYIAQEPEFSINEGYYTSVQPLKLTSLGMGKIYYTLDGTQPTEDSAQYTAPIVLENGDYIVTAYFVNDRGVASEIVSKEYHIKNDEIPPPEVNLYSGEYHAPVNIEVTDGGVDVYYTTDGSDPTYSSTAYTGPFPMPLGESRFKFAKVVDGITGTIEERQYSLIMDTDYTTEQAVADVVEYVLNMGKIRDAQGHFDDTEALYRYEYQYVSNINGVADFYVVAEVFQDVDGTPIRTGNNYAVNAYDGKLYKLQQEGRNRLSLIEIEEEPDAETESESETESKTESETEPET